MSTPRAARRGLAAAAVLCLALSTSAGAETEDGGPRAITLGTAQVDAMAQSALADNRPHLAYALSRGLLQENAENGRAHYYQAVALGGLRAYDRGRRAAKRAFRHSRSDTQRFAAATLAARLSFADSRLTRSQYWLRRAVDYAPSEDARTRTVTAFKNVRRRNPLNLQLRFSVTPSDNVNNGANSPYNIIEGVPLVGRLSPAAQALRGVVATSDLRAAYRLHRGDGHETRVTGRGYLRRVSLSESVPGVDGGDLSSAIVEAGISHLRAGTAPDSLWHFDLEGGRTWYGGHPLYDFGRIAATRRQALGDRMRLGFGGMLERRQGQTRANADTTALRAFGSLGLKMPATGGELGLFVQYRQTDSTGTNRSFDQWTGIVSYRLGRQLGPAEVKVSAGHSRVDYDSYAVVFPVPGGRADDSWFGGITATFADWDYMGFVPTVSLTAEKSRSNISRFDVDETALSIGIESAF